MPEDFDALVAVEYPEAIGRTLSRPPGMTPMAEARRAASSHTSTMTTITVPTESAMYLDEIAARNGTNAVRVLKDFIYDQHPVTSPAWLLLEPDEVVAAAELLDHSKARGAAWLRHFQVPTERIGDLLQSAVRAHTSVNVLVTALLIELQQQP